MGRFIDSFGKPLALAKARPTTFGRGAALGGEVRIAKKRVVTKCCLTPAATLVVSFTMENYVANFHAALSADLLNPLKEHMGEQSKTRLDGDDYQHLYSWYELIRLLEKDSPYDHGYVEHNGAGAADDVTLHPREGGAASRYVQVKYHVDFRKGYGFGTFLETPKPSERGLLRKLFDSWKKLKEVGPSEIWLVSNWACDDELGSVVCGNNWSLLQQFFDSGERSKLGKSRKAWKEALEASDEEFGDFIGSLRLRFSFGSHTDLEERCDDRMGFLGMKRGPGPRAHAIAAVRGWIKEGGEKKRISRATIEDAIARFDLAAPNTNAPIVSLFVHGWAKRAFDVWPTFELDWTSYFDRRERTIPDRNGWMLLESELHGVKEKLSSIQNGTFIDFRGKVPLSCGVLLGATFPAVGGYTFRTEQPSGNEIALWDSNDSPSLIEFDIKYEDGGSGDNVLVFLAITGDGRDDALAFYGKGQPQFSKVVYAEPNSGVGPRALSSAADAVALAVSGKNVLRQARSVAKAKTLHLVVFGPLSFALFLGQQLNSLGTVVTYERDSDGGYLAAAIVKTG